MDRILLALMALLCFYLGYTYLFNRDLAAKWDNSRRRTLGQDDLLRNAAWEGGARRRGILSMVVGILLLAIAAGVL